MAQTTQPDLMAVAAPDSRSTSPNFWRLWSANSFSNLADGLYQILLPLIAIRLTTSPIAVSGMTIMLSLPWLIFALFAGSIVDRSDRRKVMLWVSAGRFLLLTGLTAALLTNAISLPMLYAAALLLGIGETLMDTALTSVVPAVVPHDKLSWANARITAVQTVTNTFIGPPLAGALAAISMAAATGSSAFLYLAAGLALLLMRGSFTARTEENARHDPQFWPHLTEGVRFLWKDQVIRNLTLFTASMNLPWSGWAALLVLFVVKPGPMGLGEFEYGLLLTVMAVGGLLGSALCERIEKAVGTRNTLALDFVGTILMVGIPALTTNVIAMGAAVFMAGFGASVWVILVASIRQRLVPGNLQGRVYSASRFISWGIGPVGALLAGAIAELWGIRTMFAISGVFGAGLLIAFFRLMPAHLLQSPQTAAAD